MKKIVLIVIVLCLGIAYALLDPLMFGICSEPYTWDGYTGCIDSKKDIIGENLLYLSVTLLVFSLITYRMKDEAFRRWAKFSAWYVPILVIGMFLFTGSQNGLGAGSAITDSLNYLILFILFAIYAIVSTVKIIRGRNAITRAQPRKGSLYEQFTQGIHDNEEKEKESGIKPSETRD